MLTSYLRDAITSCEQALNNGTSFGKACQTLSNVLQGLGRFEEAMAWQTRSLQKEPIPAEIYASLGGLYAKQEEWDAAIAFYEKALQLDENYAEAHRSLASIYGQLGDVQKETEYRHRAVSLRPSWATPSNQFVLGNSLISANKWTEAIECYQRAVDLQPDFLEAQYNLGVALTEQQQWDGAIAAFNAVLELLPTHGPTRYALGKVAERRGHFSEALAHYQQAAELDPDSELGLHSVGETHIKLRQWEEAIAIYKKAIERNPDFSWSYHNLGYALLKLKQWEAAVEPFRQAIALNGDTPWTYYFLGEAMLYQQRWPEAVAAFLAAAELQPDLVGVYNRLGYALKQESTPDFNGTVARYQTHIPLKPQNQTAAFYLQLANALKQFKQYQAAVIFYRLTRLLNPNEPNVATLSQDSWEKRNELNYQVQAYRRELNQHPDYIWLYTRLGNLLATQWELPEAIALHRHVAIEKGWNHATTRDYQFSYDYWFTYGMGQWQTYLRTLTGAPNIHALEIGSYEGMSACWLLDYVLTDPTARLTCIDLFFQDSFDTNVALAHGTDKVTKRIGNSHSILATLEPHTYHLVFVDGSRFADHIQTDATLAWPTLKTGGWMIFAAYQWTDPSYPNQDPKRGIDAFLASVAGQYQLLHRAHQVIVQKTT